MNNCTTQINAATFSTAHNTWLSSGLYVMAGVAVLLVIATVALFLVRKRLKRDKDSTRTRMAHVDVAEEFELATQSCSLMALDQGSHQHDCSPQEDSISYWLKSEHIGSSPPTAGQASPNSKEATDGVFCFSSSVLNSLSSRSECHERSGSGSGSYLTLFTEDGLSTIPKHQLHFNSLPNRHRVLQQQGDTLQKKPVPAPRNPANIKQNTTYMNSSVSVGDLVTDNEHEYRLQRVASECKLVKIIQPVS